MPPSPPDAEPPSVDPATREKIGDGQPSASWTQRPPAARPSTSFADREQISRLLTNANIQFRRGLTAEAEKAITEALALRPGEAAAHELRGDILLARGDFDGALAAYKSALQHEPGKATAEAKLARTTLRQTEDQRRKQLGVAYAASDTAMVRVGGIAGDPKKTTRLAIFGSALLPGLGQFVNGQPIKAAVVACIYFLSLLGLALSPDASELARQISLLFVPSRMGKPDFGQVSGLLWFCLAVSLLDWLYAVVDAAITASRTATDARAPEKDGWQV